MSSAVLESHRNLGLYLRAVAAGLAAGLLAAAFEQALSLATRLRAGFEELGPFLHGVPFSMLCSALLAAASVWLVLRFDPDSAGSGIPQVEAALSRGRAFSWPRTLFVKFASGARPSTRPSRERCSSWRSSRSCGRSGTRWRRCSRPRRRTVSAAGCFTRRRSSGRPTSRSRLFTPWRSFSWPEPRPESSRRYSTAACFPRWTRSRGRPERARGGKVLLGAAVGALVGCVGGFEPGWLGSGESLIARSLQAVPAASAAAAVLAVRFGMTLASYSSGAAGGLFAPLLVLGCEAGLLMSHGASALFPGAGLDPAAVAIVAMGALFAGSVQAPLTGVLLMIEMTGAFRLLLPLLVASLAARFVARALKMQPIYESLLERLLDPARAPDGRVPA